MVHRVLLDLFPDLAPYSITHRWGGVLGVPRNWLPTVSFDRFGGVHQAGGYVGEGVAASHLAGRCLAALIGETEEDVGSLPWIRRPSRRWPVEPLRWLGITAGSALFRLADEREASTGRKAWEADLVWRYLRR